MTIEEINKFKQEWEEDTEGIKLSELKKMLESGAINILFNKHNDVSIKPGHLVKHFLEEFEEYYDRCKSTAEELKDNFYAAYKFYAPLKFGKLIDLEYYCWDCDKRLRPVLINNHMIGLINIVDYYENAKNALTENKIKEKYDYVLTEEFEIRECELSLFKVTDRVTTTIDVFKGRLYFKNFMKTKELRDYEDANKKSINSILGRFLLAKKLSRLNVGYGQMGNTSIDIFKKQDGTEIILGSKHHVKDGKDCFDGFDGFDYIGCISLEMWRWQCADESIIERYNEKSENDDKIYDDNDNNVVNDRNYDVVIANVKPGKWLIEHFYDIGRGPDPRIYSHLKLITD